MPPLAKHLPYSQSLCREIEQNEHLCSGSSAFLFPKEPSHFAILRCVLGRARRALAGLSPVRWRLGNQMIFDERPREDEKTDQEQEVWSAIRYLDPDEEHKSTDIAAIVAAVALLLIILVIFVVLYVRGFLI
jgi:hypothetical protein